MGVYSRASASGPSALLYFEFRPATSLTRGFGAGPKKATEEVQKVFLSHANELNPLKFDDLRQRTKDRPFSLLRGIVDFETGPGVSEFRFTNNRIDNTLLDDVLIYRMQPTS
jgi:hypothetical protein